MKELQTRREFTKDDHRQVRHMYRFLVEGKYIGYAALQLCHLAARTYPLEGAGSRGTALSVAQTRFPGSVESKQLSDWLANSDVETRMNVAYMLGEYAGEEAVDPLINRLEIKGDLDELVRTAVVDSLGMIGGQKALQMLKKSVLKEREMEVRFAALRAIGHLMLVSPLQVRQVLLNLQQRLPAGLLRDDVGLLLE